MALRVIGIVGIWSIRLYEPVWRHLREAFLGQFPGATFATEDMFFSPWQGKKMRAFADSIVCKYDDGGDDVLLVGWSMGGTIATAIAPKFKRTRVRGVVTIFSPHTLLWGLFSWMLGSNLKGIGVPVVSCSARFDWIVLWGGRYPAALKHFRVRCDHLLGLLIGTKRTELIAKEAREVLV